MSELLNDLPTLLARHLELVLIALVAAIIISVPLAVAIARRPRVAFAVVTAAGVVQTIPGLALLALMVPLLAATGVLSPFGFPPAVLALTLYALLPILRNTITGLRGVDEAPVDAARGMGMTEWQIVRLVQLPLAVPVIAAGIRTATVWTVGAATLATPVGQACLGNYIFTGLQTRNFPMLLVGVAAAAGLAIVLDTLLALVERSLVNRHGARRVWPPLAGLVATLVLVIAVLPRLAGGSGHAAAAAATGGPAARLTRVRVAGKTFTEQYILVEALRQQLARAGIAVEVVSGLGSSVIFDALVAGDVDVYVDYSGTLWTNAMKRPGSAPRWQVLTEVAGWLAHEHGIRTLGSLGFENTYAIAMRRDAAQRLGIASLSDLAQHSARLAIGGDYEFFGRAEWGEIQRAYGMTFARKASFDPSLLYEAVARGEIDAISAFSSDGRIATYDLVVLADPAGALPPYDAMILLGRRAAATPAVTCALARLHITLDQMQRANAQVDGQQASAASAAAGLLGGPTDDCASCRDLPECAAVP